MSPDSAGAQEHSGAWELTVLLTKGSYASPSPLPKLNVKEFSPWASVDILLKLERPGFDMFVGWLCTNRMVVVKPSANGTGDLLGQTSLAK